MEPRVEEGLRRVVLPAACFAVVCALYGLMVRTGLGQRIDQAPVLRHNLDRLRDADVHLADLAVLVVAVGLWPVVAWTGRRSWLRVAIVSAAAVVALGISEGSQQLLPRPMLTSFDPLYKASFPSGHATGTMVLALGLVWTAPRAPWARSLAVAAPALVATMALGFPIHRPSDILAGDLIAFAVMCLVTGVAVGRTGVPDRSEAPSSPQPARGSGQRSADRHEGSERGASRAATVPGTKPARHGRAVAGGVVRVAVLIPVLLAGEAVVLHRGHLSLGQLGPAFPLAVAGLTMATELVVATFARLVLAGEAPQVRLDDGAVGGRRAAVGGDE